MEASAIMAVHLYIAPAGKGKTAFVLKTAREMARDLQAIVRVVVATHLQARSCRRRLADAGGAIGVRILTFDRLYAECLATAGESYTELTDPIQYRLIRALAKQLPLEHYASLVSHPGFAQAIRDLIAELKAAMVRPDIFEEATAGLRNEPRLTELALLYGAYQDRLQTEHWADREGLGWLAVKVVQEKAPHDVKRWQMIAFDGFDNFTSIQLALMQALVAGTESLIVTLTGSADETPRAIAHRRFQHTRQQIETTLGVKAASLPQPGPAQVPALIHLEAGLFGGPGEKVETDGAIEMLEAPDRAAEVRYALRWLKARLVEDGLHPVDVALLARHLAPYREFIQQTASEFGLPIQLGGGQPLRSNPAVSALLDLLELALPDSASDPEPTLPRRRVIEAWRSPYFDWSAQADVHTKEPIDIRPGDAEALDTVARFGRVIGGLSQWDEVLVRLAERDDAPGRVEDEEQSLPADLPRGKAAQDLHARFRRFVSRLTPPQGVQPYREFVRWLEVLIGPDPELHPSPYRTLDEPTSLNVVVRAREGDEAIAQRDLAALTSLKDILRGLVWAEDALQTKPLDYASFVRELAGAVEASSYPLPLQPSSEGILVADVVQARGLPFRAVAVLGLAEGEFPAVLSEDPFLTDRDRAELCDGVGLALRPSTESSEAEFFYETVTRPQERLLLTRPRLAESGAQWQASPFWEEVCRLMHVEPVTLTSESVTPMDRVASWPEAMESLGRTPASGVWHWARQTVPQETAHCETAAKVFRVRWDQDDAPSYNADLGARREAFALQFGPEHMWSPSQLEAYRACPFLFFVNRVLGLEAREEPTEGLDARQLGSIYHRILEQLYKATPWPWELQELLDRLPEVAGRVLDQAPHQEGFRETAWWEQTRAEIEINVARSLQGLHERRGQFTPHAFEQRFGLGGEQPLVVRSDEASFHLRGVIDRIDRSPDGALRVIDYKLGGPGGFSGTAIHRGEKLQIPLYALAAERALGLGMAADGFYWHVRHAEPSSFTLASYEGGPEQAIELAVLHAWEAVRGARQAAFSPHPPDNDCPGYCPASAFCWEYKPRFRF
jgi:ATP-dependent helicase/nuclease subunit B